MTQANDVQRLMICLYPNPTCGRRPRAQKKRLSISLLVGLFAGAALALILSVVFCSGLVGPFAYRGWAMPALMGLAMAGALIGILPPNARLNRLEKRQYATSGLCRKLWDEYRRFSAVWMRFLLVMYGIWFAASVVLAVIFPYALGSALTIIPVLAALIIYNKKYAAFRERLAPIELSIIAEREKGESHEDNRIDG